MTVQYLGLFLGFPCYNALGGDKCNGQDEIVFGSTVSDYTLLELGYTLPDNPIRGKQYQLKKEEKHVKEYN